MQLTTKRNIGQYSLEEAISELHSLGTTFFLLVYCITNQIHSYMYSDKKCCAPRHVFKKR